ncbi:MAG: hypothetical protein KAJ75_05810 [Alphaproteobacteria bacterium]|nr:hypothetical protein [Alphaproteobacteria bacterium]
MKKSEIRKAIKTFGNGFIEYVAEKKLSKVYKKSQYHQYDIYQGVELNSDFQIDFLKRWGESNNQNKDFYLVLWHKEKYMLELILSRILFANNREIECWYLATPQNDKNKDYYKNNLNFIEKIDSEIVESVKEQQENINTEPKQFNRVNEGYLFAENESFEDVYKKLYEMLLDLVDIHSNVESKESHWLEGESKESAYLRKTRQTGYISIVKERDSYKCTACGLAPKNNDKIGLLCVHHLNPLSLTDKVVKTKTDDLVTLCPNCHKIAHKKRPIPFTAKEIKARRKEML